MMMTIRPRATVQLDIQVPGDKSISHRCAILAAMAHGDSVLEHFGPGQDCQSTLFVLQQLGVKIKRKGDRVTVAGLGLRGFRKPAAPLNCGNSGTTARLMMGVLAGQNFDSVLTGDASLSGRPMRRVMEPLLAMGARIESSTGGTLPVRILGRRLKGLTYDMPLASAQVKSSILLAGLLADGRTTVREPVPTRDHTERLLEMATGTKVQGTDGPGVNGDIQLNNLHVDIPGDVSSAAFFVAAAVVRPGSEVAIRGVGLNPTRTRYLGLLKELGADIRIESDMQAAAEPRGRIIAAGHAKRLRRYRIHGADTAMVIDEIPVLAVVAACCGDGLEVRDAEELRVKEYDRIKAITENLRAMGATVSEFDDGFCVEPSRLHGGALKSYGDHRIAMAMAIAAMTADDESTLDEAECVHISFPQFFDYLNN